MELHNYFCTFVNSGSSQSIAFDLTILNLVLVHHVYDRDPLQVQLYQVVAQLISTGTYQMGK